MKSLTGFQFCIWMVLTAALGACAKIEPRQVDRIEQQASAAGPVAFASTCNRWDDWDKPAPPFRIWGNSYFVGTCGITSILITSERGHLVIDSGTEAGAEVVAANIQALGFSLSDVRYITHTQEHFDHVGGMARLQAMTGARMIASALARPVFETGFSQADDPQFGLHDPIERLVVDQVINHGESIDVGGQLIRARFTPGHSPGAISWRWTACESQGCRTLVFSDGLSPVSAPDYRWADHPQYLDDYRASIDWLKSVEADICLAAHPSQTRLIERILNDAVVDQTGCRSVAVALLNRLDGVLAAQSAD
ncbi:MAG: subclass B3 metallo-beta-lactamase [Pseudomonadota bacterium]